MKRTPLLAVCILLLSAAIGAVAAPLRNYPQKLVQPDGSIVQCYASGDEFHHWLHDAQNYTIVRDSQTGYFVYAMLENGTLAPSPHIVGKVNPATVGLSRGVNISAAAVQTRRDRAFARMAVAPKETGSVGTINNIVIFVRFAGEDKSIFPDSISRYDILLNSSSPSTSSMFNYYNEVSYGQLAISTTFYPVTTDSVLSYQDSYVRDYYRKYDANTNPIGYVNNTQANEREQILLKNAINAVASQISPGLVVDANNNGLVDNVTFILSGDLETWNDWLFWPHMDWLTLQTVYINGKRVRDYNVQLRDALFTRQYGVYALAHEMFHALGAPDLYHYSFQNTLPVGAWDIMDSTADPPVHMSAYMKWKYGGWISTIPTVSAPGTYTLAPLTSPAQNCFAIASPFSPPWAGRPSREYFVVEYRKRIGIFENSLPGEGLLVYRINSTLRGNSNGPPDEIYVYRPGGSLTAYGIPDSAAFSSNSGRLSLTDSTSPTCFLTDGSAGGLNISEVGIIGDSITFTLKAPLPAVMAVTPLSVTFGVLNASLTTRDTAILISNRGLSRDSVRVTIDTGNVTPSLAIKVRPTEFILPGEATRACAVSVSPRDLQVGITYGLRIIIDGTPGPGQKHFEIPVAFGVVTGVKEMPEVPQLFALDQNYPNPFNPRTGIGFQVPGISDVRLAVYDILGREVAVLVNERKMPGRYEVSFDGSGLSSGVYFYRLTAGKYVECRKMVLMK